MYSELLVKTSNKYSLNHPMYEYGWKIGQLINIRPEGYYEKNQRKHHTVITVPMQYEKFHGTIPYLGTNATEIKKLVSVEYKGKYKWNTGYENPYESAVKVPRRKRDWFVDFQFLLDSGFITADQLTKILDHKQDPGPLVIEQDLFKILFHEDVKTRISIPWLGREGSVTTGTFTVGAGQNYTDWSDAEADIGTPLTGDLTFSGNTSAAIAEGSDIIWDTNTATHTLKLTVHADHRHDGVYTTSKHYVDFGAWDGFHFNETNNGDLDDVVVEYLQFLAGSSDDVINFEDGGDSGYLIAQKNIIKGGNFGVRYHDYVINCIIRNNIIFDAVNSMYLDDTYGSGQVLHVYNNTCIDGTYGIRSVGNGTPTTTVKNNLCYNNSTDDYTGTANFDVTARNVSGDATSPDGATYRSWAGTANMTDYAGDDFTLDATDATLDDGDDLSAIGSPEQFSDDIQDQSRSTWFIGASEHVAAGGANAPTGTIYGAIYGTLGGPI